jgi:5-methylcytosine-specific restriction endonuclease McrA
MRRFILARDQRCSFPGCGRRAEQCDLDHVHAFSYLTRGGKTIRVNLGPLCRQHHNAKTHGGWILTYDPATRNREFTSPLGATYTTEAAPLLT